jgi:ABC-type branched-subunit amino acid transport system ATPase component
MIAIADLWKFFGAISALKGISLEVVRDSVVAVIGPVGSGKSTCCVYRFVDGYPGTKVVPGKRERA